MTGHLRTEAPAAALLKRRHGTRLLVPLLLALLLSASVPAAAQITNGGFETGDTSLWSVVLRWERGTVAAPSESVPLECGGPDRTQ